MPKLNFDQEVPFSARQMFELVDDLENYPNFLPNCTAMEIKGEGETVYAKMTIKFGPISQSYTSKVTRDAQNLSIAAEAVDGPFSHLESLWQFTALENGAHVRFDIDFNISNGMLAIAAEPAFVAKQREILDAFMLEARRRY